MHIWEGVTLAFQQIRSEKLKSFFSLLGVILGVMFLIVVVCVTIPCCLSDIAFPCLTVSCGGEKCAAEAHQEQEHDHA